MQWSEMKFPGQTLPTFSSEVQSRSTKSNVFPSLYISKWTIWFNPKESIVALNWITSWSSVLFTFTLKSPMITRFLVPVNMSSRNWVNSPKNCRTVLFPGSLYMTSKFRVLFSIFIFHIPNSKLFFWPWDIVVIPSIPVKLILFCHHTLVFYSM